MSQVRNMRSPFLEQILYITPDGETYDLDDRPFRTVLMMEGWGSPSYEIETTRNPYQHGARVTAARANIRPITMVIHHWGFSRDDYWNKRRSLQDILRISRTNVNAPELASLRRVLSTGEVFQLDGFFAQGTRYQNDQNRWNEFSFIEQLRFNAYDPIIYDPTSVTVTYDGFDSTATQTQTLSYVGTWREYPTIVITGPCDDFTITHNDTGHIIEYNKDVDSGETVTIDLMDKSIESSVHGDVIGEVTQSSGLGQFAVLPDPQITDGDNEIEYAITNPTAATEVAVTYYKRYESI